MAINVTKAMALRLAPFTVDVERGRLRFFAAAIGETDPMYTDLVTARRAGHPDLPVPPTFLFSLELERPDPFDIVNALDIDLRAVLHGEQSFTYHSLAHAGEALTLQREVVDVHRKKRGALELLVTRTAVTRDDGNLVAELGGVLIVRQPSPTQRIDEPAVTT